MSEVKYGKASLKVKGVEVAVSVEAKINLWDALEKVVEESPNKKDDAVLAALSVIKPFLLGTIDVEKSIEF